MMVDDLFPFICIVWPSQLELCFSLNRGHFFESKSFSMTHIQVNRRKYSICNDATKYMIQKCNIYWCFEIYETCLFGDKKSDFISDLFDDTFNLLVIFCMLLCIVSIASIALNVFSRVTRSRSSSCCFYHR